MAKRTIESKTNIVPEIDCLAGYPHPRQTLTLFGHVAARKQLVSAIESSNMHHAWLFTGKEGIGKATLAYKAAIYALTNSIERLPGLIVSQDTMTQRQVQQLSHPDLLVIRRNYDPIKKRFPTTINVDEVRKLRGFLSHSHISKHLRVVIIDSSDELSVNAANALLKSLEEPPHRTLFFLIATNASKLLPTIRSRCRLLPLTPLNNDQLLAAAQAAYASYYNDTRNEIPPWKNLIASANGSPRRILALASDRGNDIVDSVEQIYRFMGNLSAEFKHALVDRLANSQAQQEYELFLTLFLDKLASLIKSSALIQRNDTNTDKKRNPIKTEKLGSWVELWETFHRESHEVKTLNLDRSVFLLNLLARFERAAVT
ncbi:MAG: DNA polymerase III subunit delta' [Hyphomicrobiaceae bacterium]|nr:DNA polymerase III subunit delta' [Hyphomicrobiaceae bacterium]